MKVITLKQPWADLVKDKIKKIETRSWYTNYRGELYIHAGKAIIKDIRNKVILDYIDINKCKYGCIIAKCRLVDCIYMDKVFIKCDGFSGTIIIILSIIC